MRDVGIIINPRAGAHRRDPALAGTLRDLLGGRGQLHAPENLDALEATLRTFRAQGISTLGIHGGDGTLHRVLSALLPLWGDDPLPAIALLPGGTMNIVARSAGIRGRPEALLRRLLAAHASGTPLPTTQRWALRFEGDALKSTPYGMLFGNGIIARFLEVYYQTPDPTPARAAWLLGRGAASALIGGRFVQQLTQPWEGTVHLDGQPWPATHWTAVAAGTVEQIGLGFTPFYKVSSHPGQMHIVGISGSVVDLARDLPRIYRGQSVARPGNRDAVAQQLLLQAPQSIPFMIDGDFYRAGRTLKISVDRPVDLVMPHPES